MKKVLLVTIIACYFAINTSTAKDYQSVHKLGSGDVISADIFNELFKELENVIRVTVSSDLVGSWSLIQTTCINGVPGNCSGFSESTFNGGISNTDGLTQSRSDTITFTDDGDGTFSWSQGTYSSLTGSGEGNITGSGNYTFIDGMGIFEDTVNSPGNNFGKFQIRRVSSTRYIMSYIASGSSSFNIVRIDKQALPPNIPNRLSADVSGMKVTLSWLDQSDDETKFMIYRRDTIRSQFIQVGSTTSEDIISYVDTVPTAGTYWYRIRSANTNGQSVGTNVIKTLVK